MALISSLGIIEELFSGSDESFRGDADDRISEMIGPEIIDVTATEEHSN